MQERRVWSLSQEDSLEKEMTTHSSIPAWKNPMNRGAWQATVHGVVKESDMTQWLNSNENSFYWLKHHWPDKLKNLMYFVILSEVAQSCLTLSDPMDCSLPGSSIHGIFLARVLEWGAIAFSNAWKWKVKVKWSHIIKRLLLLGRKAMANLHSVLKSRDITLSRNVCTVSFFFFLMVFPVVMYGCESWIIKKAVCQRTDTFKLWC